MSDTYVEYYRPWMYPKQLEAIFTPARTATIEASTKAGKSQPLDAIVYTPSGPMRMGDLSIGQDVLTADGGRAAIKGIYPQGPRQIYRVTFSDGSSAEVDGEHLWEVHEFSGRSRILTTKMVASMRLQDRCRAWVPAILPADFDAQPVPFDPYALGLLLGDGGLTTTIRFSSADPELVDALRDALPAGHWLRKESGRNVDWLVTVGSKGAHHRERGTHLLATLRKLGLLVGSSEKSVPPLYKYNSIAVRRAVLQGILDTDGFVDKHGQPGIEQTSAQLAKDIEEIVQSLGGTVLSRYRAVNGYKKPDGSFVQCKPVYRQVIRFADASWCFRLARKANLVRAKKKTGHRFFRSIEPTRVAEAQCIEIDHPRHLYLTDCFLPTHNTVACIAWLVEQAMLGGGNGKNYWWVAPVSVQADIAFTRLVRFLPQGTFTATRAQQRKTVVLLNGAVIWFKSADKPDSLYGDDVYAAVLDEASRMKEDAWYAVRSTLTFTKGPVRIIGNVKGRKNWFFRLAREAEQKGLHGTKENQELDFHRIDAYDAVDAGVLDKREIEAAKQGMPEKVFQELYLAQPSDDGGNPFGIEHIRACIVPTMTSLPPMWWGWDLAKRQDYTVGIALDRNGDVCRLERFHQIPWPDIMIRIENMTAGLPALVDSTGVGDPVMDQLKRTPGSKFEGYHFTPSSKQKLMEGLAVAIQSRTVHFPPGVLVSELENFEYELYRTGVRYSAPVGFNDDTVCALALAIMCKNTLPAAIVFTEEMVRMALAAPRTRRY